MNKDQIKKMQAVLKLQNELTEDERAELARWEAVNCGQGGKSTSDWPGWTDVAVRVASSQSNDILKKASDYSYFMAIAVVYFSFVYVVLIGLVTDMDTEIANNNFAGFAHVVYLLMFFHALAKLPKFGRKLNSDRKSK
jgi:hypothetical protein